MEELRNLNEIYNLASGRLNQYDGKDFVLPQIFKDNVKEINSNSITYNEYSAIIETRGNQNGVLSIFLPNQWFYIASYFTDFYNELLKYKKEALKVVSKERLKGLNGKSLDDEELSRLEALPLDNTSKEYLVKFMTDYNWWFGAKTIDRGDFYVSPILSSARLVNASQSFVADLCAFLADKTELVQAIIGQETTVIKIRDVEANKSYIQQIFYGAPGTGKSYEIKKQTKGESVIRTTFHPDSDYSSFVGCYKPTMGMGKVFGPQGPIKDPSGNSKDLEEPKIIYKFVIQAFLKAYLAAWKYFSDGKSHKNTVIVKKPISFNTDQGDYTITTIDDIKIVLAKVFEKDKKSVENEWPNLWKNDKFELPTGAQSGKTVEHAIAKWIYDNIESCTKDDFEKGWNAFLEKIKEDRKVEISKTDYQKYIASNPDGNPQAIKFSVEDTPKYKETVRKYINGESDRKNKLVEKIVEILKEYDVKFDDAWAKLKEDVENGISRKHVFTYKPQFLIIEEINRGNCAQIFGDLFQLLDRSRNGFSEYPIEADTDLQMEIEKAFKEYDVYKLAHDIDVEGEVDYTSNYGKNLSDDIQHGRVLLLPPNLYIWATMNTSDQSLFPIDSAFKRRWNWRYVPISNRNQGYRIKVNGNYYDWWDFLEAINGKIWEANHSEDKKLGYFFAKADGDNIIDADLFVGKVIFYLWNDVFKDFIDESGDIFNDEDDSKLTFDKFYETLPSGETKVVEKKAEQFLKNLGLEPMASENAEDDAIDFKVIYNGIVYSEGNSTNTFVKVLEAIGLERLSDKEFDNCTIVTKNQPPSSRVFRQSGDYYIYTGLWTKYKKRWMRVMAEAMELDLQIEE